MASSDPPPRPRAFRLRRLGLTIGMTLAALNIWTGSPLFALWVGSQLQGSGPPKMSSIVAVVVVLAAVSFGLVRLLAFLGERHDRLTGHSATVRIHAPWLRSMRAERTLYPGEAIRLTGLERVLVAMVVLVVLLFEVWFLFYSTSPIDGRSGRSELLPLEQPSAPAGLRLA